VAAAEEVIGVAELDRRLKRAVEGATGREWVEGELGSLKLAASGHAYFLLKDEREEAVIDCVMYRFNAQRARRHLSEGARVQVRGRATLWAPRGRLQLVAETLRPAGRGALLEALEQLKQRLAAEGLFDPARKRALPAEPRVVGVVTSAGGAAFHDIRTVAFRRGAVCLVLSPALVQGEGAPESIVRALDLLEKHPRLDVVIVGRGGGSGEDLMAFNDERVVRRISSLRVPVVSAVGHEIDTTLADLAADVRAATPSQAAELVIPDFQARRESLARYTTLLVRAMRAEVWQRRVSSERLRARLTDPRFLISERQQGLDDLASALERAASRALSRSRATLGAAERRLHSSNPRTVIAAAKGRMGPLTARLDAATRRWLAQRRATLAERMGRLDALSPLSVLARGYAIVSDEHGRALRSSRDAAIGDVLTIRLHAGGLGARVTAKDGGDET
jgi:exodeoxyribonuclease VII large subunit